MDYKVVKEKGLIPKDYKVWWGYEDDKLYEFAKEELILSLIHISFIERVYGPEVFYEDAIEAVYPQAVKEAV